MYTIASMYPAPYDYGLRHDFSFSLLKVDLRGKKQEIKLLQLDDCYAYEEAKLNSERRSGSGHFPIRSLAAGFATLGLKPSDVTHWVFPSPSPNYRQECIAEFLYSIKAIRDKPSENEILEFLASQFVSFVPHHEAHAAVSVFSSPYKTGFFLTIDGGGDPGDPRDSVFGTFASGRLDVHWSADTTRLNIGKFHDVLSDLLGFGANNSGKTSGLAAYGSVVPQICDYFAELSQTQDDKHPQFALDLLRPTNPDFSKWDNDNFDFYGKYINPAPAPWTATRDLAGYRAVDIAASGEQIWRDAITTAISKLLKEHDAPPFGCFSGGAFHNVRLNQELAQSTQFDAHFSMAPGDEGLALGAGLFVANRLRQTRIQSPYLGPRFASEDIRALLSRYQLPAQRRPASDVAELIAAGAIVGWFSGRAEYGPRSLGARSILGDPRDLTVKARLNQLAKRRDFFMPFAPAVMNDHLSQVTDEPDVVSLYMQVAVKVSESGRALIPAAVHVDGTSRIQAVDPSIAPEFYNLIASFYALTGVPALLNTSFNRHGIATIATPRQAIEHLLEGCVEYLWLDGYLIGREDFVPEIARKEESASEDELLDDFEMTLKARHHAVLDEVVHDA